MNQKTIDYREQVAEEFVKSLEEDPLHWKKTWNTGARGIPVNAANNRRYSGINNFYLRLLMVNNQWQDPRFATFNQIKNAGWHLQKGAQGVKVEYWMPIDPKLQKDALAAAQEYHAKRSAAICEYNELKEAGKLQDKTPVERSLDTAAGHPENASVQAARRMLEKRGIDWETELIKREFKTCGYLATDKTVSHMKNITKETGNIKLKDVEEMYKGIRPVSPEVKADVEAIAMDCRAQEMARAAVNCL